MGDREIIRQKHYIFGIQINKEKTHTIPDGLPSKNVIRWDFEQIAKWLKTWTQNRAACVPSTTQMDAHSRRSNA